MDKDTQKKIKKLQDNLASIRAMMKCRGLEFQSRTGISVHTLSLIENNKVCMNLTQFIAIRTFLEWEKIKQDNIMLPGYLYMLLDNEDNQDQDEIPNISKPYFGWAKDLYQEQKI